MTNNKLLLTYYGDDFTGSTDSLEALVKGGLRTALFLEPPSPERLQGRFADLQALGVAGISRSLPPARLEAELRPKLTRLKQLGAAICHYKTCSTFDSSPQVGSIGRAAEIGAEVFESPFVPMVVGAPILRRYMVFGNLFASVGSETYRLDRHPTMSQHPVTPMDEGDLRLHLAKQTDRSIALMDILQLAGDEAEVEARFEALLAQKPEIIFFDILDDSHLAKAGRLIWQNRGDRPLYAVGSSGVEYALVAHWRQIGLISRPEPFHPADEVEQLLVISGSASPVTAGQIDWAEARGYTCLRLDTVKLIDPASGSAAGRAAVQRARQALAEGRSVVLYAARGPDDPAIEATRQRLQELGLSREEAGPRLAKELGRILQMLLAETGLKRACVAGGDTSSYAVQELGIYALEVIIPTAPGSPLCRASSDTPRFDGLEIVLKGGQVGKEDYFEVVRRGSNSISN